MSTFILHDNGVGYPIPEYGKLDNLNKIMARNRSRFVEFSAAGNRVVDNSHPLVKLLLELSVDPNWEPDYLMSVINTKGKRAAATANLTTLYNNGNNFQGQFFPENNHNTMVILSMDETSSSLHNTPIPSNNSIIPPSLHPMFTTGTNHYWTIQELIDSVKRISSSDVYTMLELDLPAFVMGYYWYLKDRISRGISIGLSPHHYVLLVIMEMWMEYNDLTTVNVTVDDVQTSIKSAPFALEQYAIQLDGYINWKRRTMSGVVMKTFSQYAGYQASIYRKGNLKPYLFGKPGKSLFFVQLNWAWTLQSLYWVQGFIELGNFVGFEDPTVSSNLKSFFKTNPSYMLDQIRDPLWKKFFMSIYNDVKENI